MPRWDLMRGSGMAVLDEGKTALMSFHRINRGCFVVGAAVWLFLLIGGVRGDSLTGAATDGWQRVFLSDDFTTEWLISNGRTFAGSTPPEQTTIYLLFPPIVTQAGDHWEITFDPDGRKKARLAEHFDVFTSVHYHGKPGAFDALVRMSLVCPLAGGGVYRTWLMIRSKNRWEGRPEELNADPEHTGALYAFNLDPSNALGISFLEPVVTEIDGEWLLTVAAPATPGDMEAVAARSLAWSKAHPELPASREPELHFPPKLQARYDAWEKALRDWQRAGGNGLSPLLETFLQLTPEQEKQWVAWQRARNAWAITGEVTSFPQPADYLQDDDSAGGDAPMASP